MRFGYALLVSPFMNHLGAVPLLGSGSFLAHFLFIGLTVFFIFLTLRHSFRGTVLWLFVPPLLFLFLMSLPDNTFALQRIFASWGFSYNTMYHQTLFFTYFIGFFKNVLKR